MSKVKYDINDELSSSSSNESLSEFEFLSENFDEYIDKINTIFNNFNKIWTVKYYNLLQNGNWDDISTGRIEPFFKGKVFHLRMIDDLTKDEVFIINLSQCYFTYHNDSILTWRTDMNSNENNNALSFLDSSSLIELCEIISSIYGQNKIIKIGQIETFPEITVDNLELIAKKIRVDQKADVINKMFEVILNENNHFFEKMYGILVEEEEKYNLLLNNQNPNKNKGETLKNSLNEKVNEDDCCINNEIYEKSNFSESTNLNSNQENIIYVTHKNKSKTEIASSKEQDLELKYEHLHEKKIKSHNNDFDSCISNNYIDNEGKVIKNNSQLNEEIGCSEKSNLKLIFLIYKNLLSLSNQHLLEILLSDEYYLGTFGALEYHFESKVQTKHRDFLLNSAKFVNFLNISDDCILYKIRFLYRLTYLRDVAIGRFVEELTLRHINMMYHCYSNEILNYIVKSRQILNSLMNKLRDTINLTISMTQMYLNNNTFEIQKMNITFEHEGIETLLSPIRFLRELLLFIKDSYQFKKVYFDILIQEYDILYFIQICITYFPSLNKYFQFVRSSFEKKFKKQAEVIFKEGNYKINITMKKYFKIIESEDLIPPQLKYMRSELYNFSVDFLNQINYGGGIYTIKQNMILNFQMNNFISVINNEIQNSGSIGNGNLPSNNNQSRDSQIMNGNSNNIINNISSSTNTTQDNINISVEIRRHREFLLFQCMLNLLFFEQSFSLKYEIGEFIKCMIDTSIDSCNNDISSKSMLTFYEVFLSQIMNFLKINFNKNQNILKYDYVKYTNDSKQILLDIFTFSIFQNNQISSNIFIENDVVYDIINTISNENKYVNLFIVKFLKAVIFNSDEFMMKLLTIRTNVFNTLINLLSDSLGKTNNKEIYKQQTKQGKSIKLNILSSSILDLFDCLKKSKMKNEFLDCLYISSFDELKKLEPVTTFIINWFENDLTNNDFNIGKVNSLNKNSHNNQLVRNEETSHEKDDFYLSWYPSGNIDDYINSKFFNDGRLPLNEESFEESSGNEKEMEKEGKKGKSLNESEFLNKKKNDLKFSHGKRNKVFVIDDDLDNP